MAKQETLIITDDYDVTENKIREGNNVKLKSNVQIVTEDNHRITMKPPEKAVLKALKPDVVVNTTEQFELSDVPTHENTVIVETKKGGENYQQEIPDEDKKQKQTQTS